MQSLIVFSHLRFDCAHERRYRLLSTLAAHWRILFVEEPTFDAGDPWAALRAPRTNVTVMRPHTPLTAPGFHDDQLPLLQKLVAQVIERERLRNYGVWLDTPMALPLLQKLAPRIIVYDCMEDLAAFKAAPRQLAQREHALLKIANLVFARGPSLYDARRDHHDHVHLLPDTVDRVHFARGGKPSTAHPEVKLLPRPRLGFCGTMDDRLDIALLERVACLRPDWQVCMVGPIEGIDPAALPHAPNLHYFGPRKYAELPEFLAAFDVCLLPYACNETTRCSNPCNALEYMAAQLPVVATPIADVQRLYGGTVRFGDTPESFVEACERALVESPQQREARRQTMQLITGRTSPQRTAKRVRVLMERAAKSGLTEAARGMFNDAGTRAIRSTRSLQSTSAACVILGAGAAGLSAAYHYGTDSVLLEKEATVGGSCRSLQDTGFTFDYAGYVMQSEEPYVQDLYRLLLGDNIHWQDRDAWVYSQGGYTRHPVPNVNQYADAGHATTSGTGTRSHGAQSPARASPAGGAQGLMDDEKLGAGNRSLPQPQNLEQCIKRMCGADIAARFAIPYNRKLWTVPLAEMQTRWPDGGRPPAGFDEMIESVLCPIVAAPQHARFGYPLRGGLQSLMDGFLPLLRGDVGLDADIERVSPLLRTVYLRDGRRYRYDTLISTLPLPQLIASMGEEAPASIRRAADALRHVSLRCVNLGVGRPHLTDKHWIYYPDDTVFHRIFVQGNASPHCSPHGGFGLSCEISYSPTKPLPGNGASLVKRCIDDCIRVGLLSDADPILTSHQVDIPVAYVITDQEWAERVSRIRNWLLQFEIVPAGRHGEWEYASCDHDFIRGKRAVDNAHRLRTNRPAKTA